MQFSNKLSLAIALLASTTVALPTYRNANAGGSSSAGAAGSKCSEEGTVVCGNKQFQVCASGQWSVSMRLAEGTDCSVFGTASDAGTGTLPANPSEVPVIPTQGSATPSIPIPTTTAVPASIPSASSATSGSTESVVGGGFHQTYGGGANPHRPTTAPVYTPTTAPVFTQPSVPVVTATEQPTTEQPTTVASPTSDVPSASDTSSAPSTTSTDTGGNTTPGTYQLYSGSEDAYPKDDKWVDFDTLWDLNKEVCERPDNAGKGPALKEYIQQVGSAASIDERVILAVILQESTCNLGVGSTDGGVNNPGIMQSHDGVSYSAGDADSVIKQMITDGVEGTASGKGLVQFIEGENGLLYTGLRAYNSGENGVDESNLNDLPAGTGTASYCSDIANRLTGAKVEHM